MEVGIQIRGVTVNIQYKQSLTADMGWYSRLDVKREVMFPPRQNTACREMLHGASAFVISRRMSYARRVARRSDIKGEYETVVRKHDRITTLGETQA